MDKKFAMLRALGEEKVVAVIRAESEEQGFKIVDAVKKGGIKFLEITLTVPGAIDIIKELAKKYKNEDIYLGAGTVLDPETARAAILAGAAYIVSPCFSPEVMRMCNRYRVPCMPGAQTIKEIVACLEMGADIIKVFPGDAYSPSIIKSFKGPLPQGNFMPTGGVSLANVKDWFAAGAYAVGTGSNLTAGAKTGDFDAVTAEARKFVEEVGKVK
ncbi:MAG: bifunctional 2-keto-4-hydroxyglutarate aldolase/2-keto-3-deoxy-6-phosphogluconate aldolase [Defluviitaleaceae bacterium]|nr:bifunctional 2-keto-4-hydroxyglutarate aldolase/2-keto-3-deoxy-6-phosphogluconate aldolase [Defluviitaleaceae bacterium]MCL2239905.1 bifunctional 2-keto-4-hydroxyglutarate aldolase/2-keto-3-deoxy-6-phosphogluconate aldolase [Defluviitaleaceae bacterium]